MIPACLNLLSATKAERKNIAENFTTPREDHQTHTRRMSRKE